MNQANEDAIISTLQFVPREPSCRKPLKRIMDKDMTKSPIMGHSNSWETSVTDEEEEDAEITSDENEEERNSSSDTSLKEKSLRIPYKKIYPDLSNIGDHTTQNSPKSTSSSYSSIINTTFKTVQRKNVSSNRTGIDDRKKRETRSPELTKRFTGSSSKENTFRHTWLVCLLVFLSIIGLFLHCWPTLAENANSTSAIKIEASDPEDRFETFLKDLRGIRAKFPHQNRHTWSDISAGIEDVVNTSSKPWTFVLFSNESTQMKCLADLLGIASSKALLSENRLILNPEDFGNEYGDAIYRLRPQIMEKKAVVVNDLLSINPGAIQAFHTMCDRYNPLVEGVVYILTIIAPGYNPSEKPEVFVENQLTNRFINKVPEDKLQPLITRITDGPIIQVLPEKSLMDCSL